MKKSTKLLSVILAVVMIFSCMSVMASAYDAYDDSRQAYYTSNDTGLATLLTDEARASWFCDLIDGLLAGANIYQDISIATIDLRSINALGSTLNQKVLGMKIYDKLGFVSTFYDLGVIADLKFVDLAGINRASDTDVGVIQKLLKFIDANAGTIGGWMKTGITLGKIDATIGIDLATLTADIPDLLKGIIYGLGARTLTNGIGDDPAFPNDTAWDDLAIADKPTLDTIVQDLLVGLLTEPMHTTKITAASQNLICTNPEAYGATAAMIHTETADDGSGDTWYYIYGTLNAKGEWVFTENTTLNETDKQYITHWDKGSCLLKNFDTSILDFSGKSLYQMLGDALPWAYDTFGAPNLDGQLRATIMQFCGAINRAETDTTITEQLKEKVLAYQKIEDEDKVSGKGRLSDAFDAKTGEAGNYNFQYISLSGADINTMPDDLYYVVQWGNGWEFYHVDFSQMKQMKGEKLELFKMLNWEWQAPAWSEIMPALDSTTDSYLRNITDAIGKILDKAVLNLEWTYDSASEDNAHFEDNVMGLVKKVLKTAPELIYGKNDAYKAKAIDTQTDEQVIAVLGADIMEWLMPALVLPENITCIEQLLVYGVREFIAEILPEQKWDTQIAAASTDADYLNIALDMGMSIAVYYLKNVMALGTTTDGNGNTSYNSPDQYIAPSENCATGWNTKLSYVIDQVLALWLPDLSSKLVARNATIMEGTDGLNKLSVIFNALFPGLLSLISGCSAEIGDGTNKACVVDLKQVKDLIAGILDLKIEPIAAKLYRNSTGYANKSLYAAVVAILEDLVCGIGFNDSTDYTQLAAALDAAVASSTPLDTLVSKSSLEKIVSNLLWVISDTETMNWWPNNVLLLLMQLTGQMDDMTFDGITMNLDAQVYAGSTSATITPTVELNTTGIKTSYYTNGYMGGTFQQDNEFSGTLLKYEVYDLDGNKVATVDNINATIAPNEAYNGSTVTVANVPEAATVYTLKSYVRVTMPNGDLANNGEAIVSEEMFIAMSGSDDSMAALERGYVGITNSYVKPDISVKLWNIYLDENTPLAAAKNYTMTVQNLSKTVNNDERSRKFYISDYGTISVDKDADGVATGGITISGYKAGAAIWKVTPSSTGVTTSYEQDSKGIPFYWTWNCADNTKEMKPGNNNMTINYQQWEVDTLKFNRDMYPDDFTTVEFVGDYYSYGYVQTGKNFLGGASRGDVHNYDTTLSSNPYIIMYNSYGLKNIVDQALRSGRQAENYTEESWNNYMTALKAAVAEYYMAKNAATFAADHTAADGTSNFKNKGDALKQAIEDLVSTTDSASSSATDYTAEEKAVLANLKATLDAQGDKTNLNNKNYIMYRWLKYYNEYAWLNSVYNNAQIPSGIANNKLTGVPSDNDTIDAVIAAAPANKQGALNAMVVAPTAEETAAAQQAKDDFVANLPTIDTSSIAVGMTTMAQNESRLIARSPDTYYLQKAYNMVKDISDPNAYTAESWAKFNTARTAADIVLADATSTPAKIHEARYDLLVAYKGLIAAGTDVDLDALKDVMAYVDTICANPTLFQPTAASGYATLDEALAAVFAEAGVKVTVGDDTYYIGGGDTGAAWLDEAGLRTAVEANETVTRVVKEIKAALANIESAIKVIPDEAVSGNTTAVDYANLIVDGIKPGTINTVDELLALVKTTAPAGYSANLAVKASAANGFGTGTKVVLTVNGVAGFEIKHTVMVYGDVNGDGAIDAFDAALINMNQSGAASLTGDFATAGDTNADGSINVTDYDMVWNYAVGNGSIAQTR